MCQLCLVQTLLRKDPWDTAGCCLIVPASPQGLLLRCLGPIPPAPTRARLRAMGQGHLLQLHQDLLGSWGHLLLTQA